MDFHYSCNHNMGNFARDSSICFWFFDYIINILVFYFQNPQKTIASIYLYVWFVTTFQNYSGMVTSGYAFFIHISIKNPFRAILVWRLIPQKITSIFNCRRTTAGSQMSLPFCLFQSQIFSKLYLPNIKISRWKCCKPLLCISKPQCYLNGGRRVTTFFHFHFPNPWQGLL